MKSAFSTSRKEPDLPVFTRGVEDGVITDCKFVGGCAGNTQGVASLVKGMSAKDAWNAYQNGTLFEKKITQTKESEKGPTIAEVKADIDAFRAAGAGTGELISVVNAAAGDVSSSDYLYLISYALSHPDLRVSPWKISEKG